MRRKKRDGLRTFVRGGIITQLSLSLKKEPEAKDSASRNLKQI